MTMNKILRLIIGNTLASFSIACVIQASFGVFSTTAAITAISNWTGMTLGVAGMVIELIMLLIAIWKGEGIGWTSICNATYGSLLMDAFLPILPKSPFMIIGLLLLPFAWAMMGSVGLGENGANTLMNAILKHSKLNITVIRGIQEFILLTIGFLGARDSITVFTVILVFGLGPLLQIVYKWISFDPTKVKHNYIIGGK